MKVSIITVALNNAEYIEACIQSVINQGYENIEYIVIDGGSTDGTIDIIKKYEDKINVWISEPDRGIYDAMNKGIRMATGDVVGFLNADDVYYDPSVLENVAKVMGDQSVDACYSDLVYRYDLQKIIRYWRSCEFKDGLLKKRGCFGYRLIQRFMSASRYMTNIEPLIWAIRWEQTLN